jgi:amino acid adenylation domain-containing protein
MYSAKLSREEAEVYFSEDLQRHEFSFVGDLVAKQATANPKAIAVAAGQNALSYGELDRRANQLACQLRALGVGRDSSVGIYLDRSPEMVMAALAVLRAGAAYLPLDPSQPIARLQFMLQDAGARVVVSTKQLADKLSPTSARFLTLDGDAAKISAHPTTARQNSIQASDLAYIIYTSGTTGQPKGVEVQHSGLSNLVGWHRRAFQVTAADRATSMASLGFDAAVWELWPYLASGASIHIPEERVRTDANALRDWMVAERITISFVPTAIAESLIQMQWPAVTGLRFLLTGADTLKKYPARGLPFVLVNNYGPTECSVVSSSGVIPPDAAATQAPSIGRPIDGVQIYILDESRKPVGDGETGELYIGGANLARGYRNRPELTSERFVLDPFSDKANARMYRTGDLGRWLPDGQIAFLGRLDEQVKIRGYRVEPGEIATVLGQHRDIQTCAVIAREDTPGEKELVAYFVPAPSVTLHAGALRDYLRQRVPDYMLPSEFVALEKLPLNASGKLDRDALPARSSSRSQAQDYVGPRTPVEEELVKILAPLLKLDRVGVNDNFFLLGGHSLLGTQLIARISERFGVDLTLLTLFDHPTVADMAVQIEDLIFARIETMSEAQA